MDFSQSPYFAVGMDAVHAQSLAVQPGEMEGVSIGIDAVTPAGGCISCDLCGASFVHQAELLEHNRAFHLNEIEAQQNAHIVMSCPRLVRKTSTDSWPPLTSAAAAAVSAPIDVASTTIGNEATFAGSFLGENSTTLALNHAGTRFAGTIYKCRHCIFSTRVKEEYQEHERIHRPLECPFCSFSTFSSDDLKEHVLDFHEAELVDPAGTRIPTLELHEEEENDDEQPLVGVVLPSGVSFNPAAEEQDSRFGFPETNRAVANDSGTVGNASLAENDFVPSGHLKQRPNSSVSGSKLNHSGASSERPLGKDDNLCAEAESSLLPPRHATATLPSNMAYFCPHCDFVATKGYHFHDHFIKHLSVPPFKCSACPRSSKWQGDVNKHIRIKNQQGDKSHRGAKTLCLNEYGVRSYEKYERFIKKRLLNGKYVSLTDQKERGGSSSTLEKRVPAAASGRQESTEVSTPGPSVVPLSTAKPPVPKSLPSNPTALASSRNSSPVLKCDHCDYVCYHRDIMLGHLGAHADALPFVCSRCGLANKWHHTVWIHLQRVHREEQVTLHDISLRLDYRQSGNVFRLADPSKIVHPVVASTTSVSEPPKPQKKAYKVKKLFCNKCPYHTVQRTNLEKHREGHVRAAPHIRQYKCPHCDFWQDTKHAMYRHLPLHPQHQKRSAMIQVDGGPSGEASEVKLEPSLESPGAGHETDASDERSELSTKPKEFRKKRKAFACEICPFETWSDVKFVRHKKYHKPNPNAVNRCRRCSYWTPFGHLLPQHERLHYKRPPSYKRKSANHSTAVRNTKTVTSFPDELEQCDVCPYATAIKKSLLFHKQFHRPNSKAPYRCKFCGYWSMNAYSLPQHVRLHKDEADYASSLKENVEFKAENDVARKVKTEAPTEKTDSPIKRRSRPTVAKDSSCDETNDGILFVISSIQARKYLACPECPALYCNEMEYSRHLDRHGGPAPLKCKQCSYAASSLYYINQHEHMHTKEYMEKKLGFCHRSSSGAGSYHETLNEKHEETISNREKPDTCSLNGAEETPSATSLGGCLSTWKKASKDTASLPVEERISESVSNTNIELVGRFFAQPSKKAFSRSLLVAELHFTKAVFERRMVCGQFRCPFCPAMFNNRSVFRLHAFLHNTEPRRWLRCHLCSYSVDSSSNMAAHVSLHYVTTNSHVRQIQQGHSDKNGLTASSKVAISALFQRASAPQTIPGASTASSLGLDVVTNAVTSAVLKEEIKLFACPVCPYTYHRKDGVQNHMKWHMVQQQLRCPYCSFSMNNANALRDHISTHFAAPKFYHPQAFLHFDDLKIKLNGVETMFEDRGRLGELNSGLISPNSVPEFIASSPEQLVEFIESDVFLVVEKLLKATCEMCRRSQAKSDHAFLPSIESSCPRRNMTQRVTLESQENVLEMPMAKRMKTIQNAMESGSLLTARAANIDASLPSRTVVGGSLIETRVSAALSDYETAQCINKGLQSKGNVSESISSCLASHHVLKADDKGSDASYNCEADHIYNVPMDDSTNSTQ